MFVKVCSALIALFCASVAQATAFYCAGTVSMVWSLTDGSMFIRTSYRGDHTQMCNLLTDWNGISPAQCKNWYAVLLTAKTTGDVIQVYYPNNPYSGCSALPTYGNTPAPGYIGLGTDL